ncbi:MAG: hypothetical protein IPH79_01900 [Sphingomonadales bacterium]|nr:hypothetical protein [Sphingomonadales bacterium]
MIDRRAFCAMLLACGFAAMPLQPIQAEAKVKLDFSDVTSVEDAKRLEAKGELVKILLFPEEFGGADIPANVVFVPEAAADAKALITETLIKYVEDDLINKLTVEPEYKGNSFVPSRIVMKASHSDKHGGFEPTIKVW